jgi:tetratricopeptide (TPR) repeat protein
LTLQEIILTIWIFLTVHSKTEKKGNFGMKLFRITIILAALLITQAIFAQNKEIADFVARGDSAYAAFDNQAALEFYTTALEKQPENYAALWRTVRAYSDVGEAEKSKDAKRSLFKIADSLAHKCVALHPDSAESHFVLAMAVGRMALFVGGKKKISYSKVIETAAKRTIEIDSTHDGAYHTLGRWHYEISTLSWFLKAAAKVIYGGVPPGASLEEAARNFELAIKYAPEKILHHLEYGRTLIKLKRYSEARKHLERCESLTPTLWDDAMRKEEAAELFKKIRNKKDKG